MFELNNLLVFDRTWAVEIQSIIVVLEVIHEALTTAVTKLDHLSIYFSIFRLEISVRELC